MTTDRDALRCEYRFSSGTRCGATAEHDVHHGRWHGIEDNHDFAPRPERRSGSDRRAALAAEPALDVERLAWAMHTQHIGDLHEAGEGWCGEEAATVAAEYARLASEERP